ncbi:MAG: hypothetical protein ACKO6N_14075 [Myxococcota bacterium]
MCELRDLVENSGLELDDVILSFTQVYISILEEELGEMSREELIREQASILLAVTHLQTQWRLMDERLRLPLERPTH